MAILITNDDGIDAPGLQTLVQVIDRLYPGQSLVIAPQEQHSGCGHRVTVERPLQLEQRGEQWAVDGTPVDCVRLGIHEWGSQIEWVLAGINAGGNLGSDLYLSGTVGAVREAALHRIPAIAISHYRQGSQPFDWQQAARWTGEILQDLWLHPQPGSFWNVNLPHLDSGDPPRVIVPLCTQPLPVAYRVEGNQFHYIGRYAQRKRDPDADVDRCLGGAITLTTVKVAN
ncbi:MAG: 5'/3'-nucleotidase SurE [Cyanobacteriota bacterium]|nr:5'/3'-nucleotidase SurE [Cyanobacteriota bacterium]